MLCKNDITHIFVKEMFCRDMVLECSKTYVQY